MSMMFGSAELFRFRRASGVGDAYFVSCFNVILCVLVFFLSARFVLSVVRVRCDRFSFPSCLPQSFPRLDDGSTSIIWLHFLRSQS